MTHPARCVLLEAAGDGVRAAFAATTPRRLREGALGPGRSGSALGRRYTAAPPPGFPPFHPPL